MTAGSPAVVLTVLLAAALAAHGCGGERVDVELVAAGQGRYLVTCATCHGSDARGSPRLGKSLHDNQFIQGLSDEGLVDFLRTGRSAFDPLNERGVDMPPRGGNPALTDDDLRLIVAYLRSLC